jgi:hypothetical protein
LIHKDFSISVVKSSEEKREKKIFFVFTIFLVVRIKEELFIPIVGCLYFLTDCDAVLGLPFLAFVLFTVVKPSAAVRAIRAALFPFLEIAGTAGTSFLSFLLAAKSADSGGLLGSKTLPTISTFVFSALFFGATDDVTSRRVMTLAHKALVRSVADIFPFSF